ncbi:MAG: acetyl-CoA carboxylase carboxyl transferase subunit alpha/beta [Desulfovibrionaceae bacterium]
MDIDKKLEELTQRVQYARDILGDKVHERLETFAQQLAEFDPGIYPSPEHVWDALTAQQQRLTAIEAQIDDTLTPMDRVRIVRHPQRICLKDILENVYDNYTEIGGRDEHSIDPGMLIARAYITRRVGHKTHYQPVMVVGQEKGHGEEFRNGGSIKPWGNANALKYMKVAALENIPIHTYVFTPGSYPVEDFPGAAQQIAENIYEMAGLTVPIVAVFSEGGSGGAEAIGLADKRLMLSHGYYSVISPEGAAAIEGRIRQGQRAPVELIERCAQSQRITAADNLQNGYIDAVIQEPPLGARPDHFEFFRKLRAEIIRATDEVALSVRSASLRKLVLRGKNTKAADEDVLVRWNLTPGAKQRLLRRRHRKYRRLSRHAYQDNRSIFEKAGMAKAHVVDTANSVIRYGLLKNFQKGIGRVAEEMGDELSVFTGRVHRLRMAAARLLGLPPRCDKEAQAALTCLSEPDGNGHEHDNGVPYVSPRAFEDREYTCPNAKSHGCLDIWARDLFTDFAGVCPNCGHHFPMEYEWYLANLFDPGTVREFNAGIESGNPTGFPGFDERLAQAKEATGLKSSCMTFTAELMGIRLTCATLIATFRGGSVGAAEGEKFIRALEIAQKRHQPFLAYVHGTAGIRIQEGVNGLIQMPRVTMAVRRYIEAGGLYIVLYDTNSYAGPVASFLGCSPYQYAVRSSRLGFAGPGVIKETTGLDIAPDYHNAFKALKRGHIQDLWDRREIRKNLHQAFLTIGGRNLYYR